MFTIFILAVLLLAFIALRITKFLFARKLNKNQADEYPNLSARELKKGQEFITGLSLASWITFSLTAIILALTTVTFVPDGHVAVTRAFGEYERSLEPGPQLLYPWESTSEEDTRIKSFTYAGNDSDDNETNDSDFPDITAQAFGGGSLVLDLTVQVSLVDSQVPALYKDVGEDWYSTIVHPRVRSCARDSTPGLTVDQAFGSERKEISRLTLGCLQDNIPQERFGIVIEDVLVRDVDPGNAVLTAIDTKQKAEQELLQRSVDLEKAEIDAQIEAQKAFGISQAEQIIACGGVETIDTNNQGVEINVVVPDNECDDQFSAEYLDWLWLQQVPHIEGLIITDPGFQGNLFVNPPAASFGDD